MYNIVYVFQSAATTTTATTTASNVRLVCLPISEAQRARLFFFFLAFFVPGMPDVENTPNIKCFGEGGYEWTNNFFGWMNNFTPMDEQF